MNNLTIPPSDSSFASIWDGLSGKYIKIEGKSPLDLRFTSALDRLGVEHAEITSAPPSNLSQALDELRESYIKTARIAPSSVRGWDELRNEYIQISGATPFKIFSESEWNEIRQTCGLGIADTSRHYILDEFPWDQLRERYINIFGKPQFPLSDPVLGWGDLGNRYIKIADTSPSNLSSGGTPVGGPKSFYHWAMYASCHCAVTRIFR